MSTFRKQYTYLEQSANWDPKTWMINVPRNVYLSEISIPGSWNSLNPDFQTMSSAPKTTDAATTVINGQYDVGVRAFHLDTRFRTNVMGIPTTLETDMTLSIANGGDTHNVRGAGTKVMQRNESPSFTDVLTAITNNVKENEYIVVICTFAQNSFTPRRTARAPFDNYWYDRVIEACNNNTKIYDARNLTANTVVKDVLGSVVVIACLEGDVTSTSFLQENSKCLIVKAPLTLTQVMFDGSQAYQVGDFYKRNNSTNSTIGINLYNTQAQIMNTGSGASGGDRGYKPSFTQRETIAGNILSWAKSNYTTSSTTYNHNSWIYLGLGGYLDGDTGIPTGYNRYTHVANTLNGWINNKVNDMNTDKKYYPIGINLMNFVTNTTYGKPVVENILKLNSRYQQAYDPQRSPIDGSVIPGDVSSAAPGYSSGMVDNNTNAIDAD